MLSDSVRTLESVGDKSSLTLGQPELSVCLFCTRRHEHVPAISGHSVRGAWAVPAEWGH